MASASDVRPFLPIDLPLVHRLTPHGVSLDSALSLTRGVQTLGGAVWNSVPLSDFGTRTFILRDGDSGYIGQFRHRVGEPHARLTFIAPNPEFESLEPRGDDGGWLALIDAMVGSAGKRGALRLNAEVDEDGAAFVLLRQCGFAIYARQQIWRRDPAPIPPVEPDSAYALRAETDADAFSVNALVTNVVPRMVTQADAPPETGRGLVCEQNGRIGAYFAVQEGRSGIYVQAFIHPELYDQAGALHRAMLARLPRAERGPLYVCVRRYQDWLRGTLDELGFTPGAAQAVMVKHTVARIVHPVLKAVPVLDGAVRVGPPIKMVK